MTRRQRRRKIMPTTIQPAGSALPAFAAVAAQMHSLQHNWAAFTAQVG